MKQRSLPLLLTTGRSVGWRICRSASHGPSAVWRCFRLWRGSPAQTNPTLRESGRAISRRTRQCFFRSKKVSKPWKEHLPSGGRDLYVMDPKIAIFDNKRAILARHAFFQDASPGMAMVVSGLWHGASWNFALWGLYHGLLLVGYRLATPRIPAASADARRARRAVAIMFGFTLFGWFLFRALELGRIASVLAQDPFAFPAEQQVATVVVLTVTLACSVPLVIAALVERRVMPWLERTQLWLPAQTTAWALFALAMFTFVRMSAADFIYFAF